MRIWTAAHHFEWTPIIAFSARRLELLQWLQDNVRPVAFLERDDTVGVAIESRYVRLEVTRDGLTIQNGKVDDVHASDLVEVIDGFLSSLRPEGVKLAHAAHAFGAALDAKSYDAEAERFARRVTQTSDAEVVPVDAAVLADFRLDGFDIQSEWGIVDRDQCVERIENPHVGRAGNLRAFTKLTTAQVDALPEAGIFIDSFTQPAGHLHASGAVGIIDAVRDVDSSALRVASAIQEGMR